MPTKWQLKKWLVCCVTSITVGCSEPSHTQTACILEAPNVQLPSDQYLNNGVSKNDDQPTGSRLFGAAIDQNEKVAETTSLGADQAIRAYESDCYSLTNSLSECKEIASQLAGLLRSQPEEVEKQIFLDF